MLEYKRSITEALRDPLILSALSFTLAPLYSSNWTLGSTVSRAPSQSSEAFLATLSNLTWPPTVVLATFSPSSANFLTTKPSNSSNPMISRISPPLSRTFWRTLSAVAMSNSIAAAALSYAGSGVVLPYATNSSTKVLPLSKVRALLLHIR